MDLKRILFGGAFMVENFGLKYTIIHKEGFCGERGFG
jgi:hypothetical protein